jgi:hypothetical protein
MRRDARHVDERNYDREARDLVKGLSEGEKYKLYEIVLNQQQKAQSESREHELVAVRRVLESDRYLDKNRLKTMSRGYKSSMAQEAGLGDLIANNNPKRKKS